MKNRKYLAILATTSIWCYAAQKEFNINMQVGLSSVDHDSIADIEMRFDEISALDTWESYRNQNIKNNSINNVMINTRLGRIFIKKDEKKGQVKSDATSEVYLLPVTVTSDSITLSPDDLVSGDALATTETNKTVETFETQPIEKTMKTYAQVNSEPCFYKNANYCHTPNDYAATAKSVNGVAINDRPTANQAWAAGFYAETDSSGPFDWKHPAYNIAGNTQFSDNKLKNGGTAGFNPGGGIHLGYEGSTTRVDYISDATMTGDLANHKTSGTNTYTGESLEVDGGSATPTPLKLDTDLEVVLTGTNTDVNAYNNTAKVYMPYNQITVKGNKPTDFSGVTATNITGGATIAEPAKLDKYLTTKVITNAGTKKDDTTQGTNWPYADYPAYIISENSLTDFISLRNEFMEATSPTVIDMSNHHIYKNLDATFEARYNFDDLSILLSLSGHYPIDFKNRDTTKLVLFTPEISFDGSVGVQLGFDKCFLATTVGLHRIEGDLVLLRYNNEDGETLKYINYDNTYSGKGMSNTILPNVNDTLYFIEIKAESKGEVDELTYFSKYRKSFKDTVSPEMDKIAFKQDLVSIGLNFAIV